MRQVEIADAAHQLHELVGRAANGERVGLLRDGCLVVVLEQIPPVERNRLDGTSKATY